MKTRLMLITGVAALAVNSCLGQTSFANLFWEASDGGTWTRNQLTTTHQNVQFRLVAEWGGDNAYGFGGMGFDVVVGSVDSDDSALSLLRLAPFDIPFARLAAIRQGNVIKLDNELDLEPPGTGPLWIEIAQSNGQLGAVVFRFDLLLADVGGTREIDSLHRMRDGSAPTNAALFTEFGTSIRVVAPIFGVDVTYVPAPVCLALLPIGAILTQRRRR